MHEVQRACVCVCVQRVCVRVAGRSRRTDVKCFPDTSGTFGGTKHCKGRNFVIDVCFATNVATDE